MLRLQGGAALSGRVNRFATALIDGDHERLDEHEPKGQRNRPREQQLGAELRALDAKLAAVYSEEDGQQEEHDDARNPPKGDGEDGRTFTFSRWFRWRRRAKRSDEQGG